MALAVLFFNPTKLEAMCLSSALLSIFFFELGRLDLGIERQKAFCYILSKGLDLTNVFGAVFPSKRNDSSTSWLFLAL